MKSSGARKRPPVTVSTNLCLLLSFGICAAISLALLSSRSVDPRADEVAQTTQTRLDERRLENESDSIFATDVSSESGISKSEAAAKRCATVEEMGEVFERGFVEPSLRVRGLIQRHFQVHGAERVRSLPPEQFCRRGFVIGKAFQAGFGNEMYKILTGAALSIMLNRSLIIGQTRGKYPFGDYISYTSHAFTLGEVKHLWHENHCVKKYGRDLAVRIDDFENPVKSGVLCSNWIRWKQPIIWFQGTTDAVAAQFFLKSSHPEMRKSAVRLFGDPGKLDERPNVFGELLRVLISPQRDVAEAVDWVIKSGSDPDISLHMRMLMNRSVRAVRAALVCLQKAIGNLHHTVRPRVVLISDTPSFIKEITPHIHDFAEVLHFNYEHYRGNVSVQANVLHSRDFRSKDWGPAPRWVAFVDFFLASRAKSAVITGAHRRVGTTYAQLIAALASANRLDDRSSNKSFSFLSSFQSNLLSDGLKNQIGWGHAWNRFAGPLSCRKQTDQCAFTPLMPPAWWDGTWQSPIPRDIRRLQAYGFRLSDDGTVDQQHLNSYCKSRKKYVITTSIAQM
uniref:Transmembrane protein n=1 Tax=Kalanchoe fedtschenkoi TaxID=63787 RepID=A0A7N0U8Z9_KALFE